jgi:DNA-binding NtrC family response regulator
MENEVEILIVSNRIDNRRILLHTLEGLPVNTFSASTVGQAFEFLSFHPQAVVFCEERLPDGSYRELLVEARTARQLNRLIVVMSAGEWEECLEALKLGAAEVLRCPLRAPDIEIALFHAMRAAREIPALHVEA